MTETRFARMRWREIAYPFMLVSQSIIPSRVPDEVLAWCNEQWGYGPVVPARHPQQDAVLWNAMVGEHRWMCSPCGIIYIAAERDYIEFKLRWF